jgi:eukaryotic-like serine/threonine-protein kinase
VDPLDRLRTALAGRYAVEREIGRGGMAIVCLAHDLRHSRDVAIKVLKPEFAMAVSAERFLREIQIEAQLKHPYILPLFDSGEGEGLLYYVMPYVAGQSLQDRLNLEVQLPLEEALRITSEIAEALSYAHARGVVHRDVKPGNILLDENHALLADFGIARAVTELGGSALSDSGMVVGTPEYMSPEQCSDKGKLDGRSDIYALGCVLYQMLSGEPPFTGPTAQAIIARHLQERPRSLRVVRSTVPEHIEEAVQVALAKVPADRFTTALQFVAALGPEGETAPAIRRARAARRRRGRQTAAVLAGAALAVTLGFWKVAGPNPASVEASGTVSGSAPLSNIAVLYLQDRSEQGKLEYLSAGLTEDLIDQLAAVKSLRVISPDGVRRYRGGDVPLDSIVHALHIGTLVTGTINRAGDRLRASVRLTDATTGTQLFSGSFEKPFGNVLDLRDQMADEITRQLRVRLGEAVQLKERRAGTRNATAWDLVHRAEQLRARVMELPSSESVSARAVLNEADSLLVIADTLDSGWADPVVLRGWVAYDQADRAADVMDTAQSASAAIERWIQRGIAHANHALEKSRGSPEALELRGTLLYRSWALSGLYGIRDTTAKLERAERDLRGAASVQHRHQARALSTLSAVLEFSGKVAEANLAAERAYEADAFLRDANVIMFRVFNTSLDMKRYGDAERWCERGRRTFPQDWTFLMCQLSLLGWSPVIEPDVNRAWGVLRQLDTVAPADALVWIKPEMTMMVAAVLARAGLGDSAERVIARTKMTAPPDPQLPYYEALARVRLKQPVIAAGLVEELVRRSPNLTRFLRSRTAFESLWADPRLGDLR